MVDDAIGGLQASSLLGVFGGSWQVIPRSRWRGDRKLHCKTVTSASHTSRSRPISARGLGSSPRSATLCGADSEQRQAPGFAAMAEGVRWVLRVLKMRRLLKNSFFEWSLAHAQSYMVSQWTPCSMASLAWGWLSISPPRQQDNCCGHCLRGGPTGDCGRRGCFAIHWFGGGLPAL